MVNEERLAACRKLLGWIEEIEAIASGEIDEREYALVFARAPKVRKLQQEVGVSIDYYNPDTSYSEDVRALVDHLVDQKDEIREIARRCASA